MESAGWANKGPPTVALPSAGDRPRGRLDEIHDVKLDDMLRCPLALPIGQARCGAATQEDRGLHVEAPVVLGGLGVRPDAFDVDSDCARGQDAGGGTNAPDSTGLKFSIPMVEKSIAASQPSQSIPSDLSSESQIPMCWGEPSLTMTADQ